MALLDGTHALLSARQCLALRDVVLAAVAAAYDVGEPSRELLEAAYAISQAAASITTDLPIRCDSLRSHAIEGDEVEDWLWITDAARIAGMTPQAMTKACREDRITCRRVGGRWQTTRRAAQAMRRPA